MRSVAAVLGGEVGMRILQVIHEKLLRANRWEREHPCLDGFMLGATVFLLWYSVGGAGRWAAAIYLLLKSHDLFRRYGRRDDRRE